MAITVLLSCSKITVWHASPWHYTFLRVACWVSWYRTCQQTERILQKKLWGKTHLPVPFSVSCLMIPFSSIPSVCWHTLTKMPLLVTARCLASFTQYIFVLVRIKKEDWEFRGIFFQTHLEITWLQLHQQVHVMLLTFLHSSLWYTGKKISCYLFMDKWRYTKRAMHSCFE